VRRLPVEEREQYCVEITASFKDCVNPQRCSMCKGSFSGNSIIR